VVACIWAPPVEATRLRGETQHKGLGHAYRNSLFLADNFMDANSSIPCEESALRFQRSAYERGRKVGFSLRKHRQKDQEQYHGRGCLKRPCCLRHGGLHSESCDKCFTVKIRRYAGKDRFTSRNFGRYREKILPEARGRRVPKPPFAVSEGHEKAPCLVVWPCSVLVSFVHQFAAASVIVYLPGEESFSEKGNL
jgi:hypothetical protein